MENKRRKYKNIRKISIRNRLFMWMVGIALLQGILFFFVWNMEGGFRYLEESSSESMVLSSENRKSQLEERMIQSWSNISGYERMIGKQISDTVAGLGKTLEDIADDTALNETIIRDTAPLVVDMLRQTGTNEAFLLLNRADGSGSFGSGCGFHVRDLDPSVNMGVEDLLLETGSSKIAREQGITLDYLWKSQFDKEELPESYQKMLEWGNTHSEYTAADLGYWTEAFQWKESDMKVMSYTMPLLDEQHRVYGIIGISVTEDYLRRFMPAREIGVSGNGAYMLAKSDGGGICRPILTSGVYRENIQSQDGLICLYDYQDYEDMYRIENSDLYATVNTMQLYRRNSPFKNDRWVFVSVMPEASLFQSSIQIKNLMGLTFVISLTIGCFFAGFASYQINRPVEKLIYDIRKQKDEDIFENLPCGIREIDELRGAICEMDTSIRENGYRLSRMLKLVNLPLGAVEYSENPEWIFATSKVVSLLNMDESMYHNGRIRREYFEEIFKAAGIFYLLEESGEVRYSLTIDGEERWLHIESMVRQNKVFIIIMDQTDEILERRQIEYERDYDVMTGLLNRRAFRKKVAAMMEAKTNIGLGAMVMWDLDNLKYVNDSYGHDVGDKYIQQAARVFGGLYTEFPGIMVGRMAGDEFMAFVPNCRDKSTVLDALDRIREKLHRTKLVVGEEDEISLRASGGVAWYPDDGTSFEWLIKCADFAMYDTKTSYKGYYKQFNRNSYYQNSLLLNGHEELNRIIEEKQVDYYFQPIVSVADGRVFAYEALMRPRSEKLVSPTDVMRMAYNQSRLAEIEKLTFEQAFYFCALQPEKFGDAKLFVNSVPNQVISEKTLHALFEAYPVCRDRIVVEIVENERIDMDRARQKRYLCQKYGIEMALDDYGSGYSTEETLLYLRPKYVKIDMALIQGISKDKDRQEIVKNLLAYTKKRKIKVVAESIENGEDMETVIRLGVDYLQGYYLGKPKPEMVSIPPEITRQIEELNRKYNGGSV